MLTLFLLPLPLLAGVLAGGQALAPAEQLQHFPAWRQNDAPRPPWDVLMWDSLSQVLPWQAEAHRSVDRGRIALWNPLEACGAPLLVNSQTSALSPYWLLLQEVGVVRSQAWLALFQLGIAGAGMYGFLRAAGLRRSSAILGAAAYQLSGWSLCWLEFPNRHAPVAWFPICLWMVQHSAQRGWKWRAAGSAAVAISLVSSHLQFEFYLVAGAALGALGAGHSLRLPGVKLPDAEGVRPFAEGPSRWLTHAAPGLLVIVLGLVMAAPQLLPSLELGRHSHRLGGISWGDYTQRMSFAMPSWWLAEAFVPGFFGNPGQGTMPYFPTPGTPPVIYFSADFYEFCVFTGVAPLYLAINGIRQCRKNRLAAFLTILGIVSLLLALGTVLNAPLYFLIPGFSAMAGTARMLFLYAFSIAGLAAIGLDSCSSRDPVEQARSRALPLLDAAIVMAVGFASCVSAALFLAEYGGHIRFPDPITILADRGPQIITAAVILVVSAGSALLIRTSREGIPAAVGMLILFALTTLQLLDFGFSVIRVSPARNVFPRSAPMEAILAEHPFRLMETGSDWSLNRSPAELSQEPPLPPNTALFYNLGSIDSYDSLNSRAYIDFVTRLEGKSTPPVPPENGNMVLLANPAPQLLRLAGIDLVVSSAPVHADNLRAIPSDGPLLLYQVRNPDSPAFVLDKTVRRTAAIRTWASGIITVEQVRGPGSLEILDAASPGWSARVDGNSSPVGVYLGLFKSVPVGRGIHTVTLEYRPLSFRLGVFLSALAVGGMAGVLIATTKRTAQQQPGAAMGTMRRETH